MKKTLLISTAVLLFSAFVGATTVAKFSGRVDVPANKIHKNGVQAAITLNFEGDQLAQVFMKADTAVFGKTDFPSTEQAVLSRQVGANLQMAVVYKLQGPPHKWYYVFVFESADQGKTYTGTLYKGLASFDDINTALAAGTIPSDWPQVGTGTLTAN